MNRVHKAICHLLIQEHLMGILSRRKKSNFVSDKLFRKMNHMDNFLKKTIKNC